VIRPVTIEIDGRRVPGLCSVRTLIVHISFCWDWRLSPEKRIDNYHRIQYYAGDELEEYARSIGANGRFHVYE
jgi:hypothetical protein